MKRIFKQKLFFAFLFFAFIIALRFTGITSYFTLEAFKAQRTVFLQTVENHYLSSVLSYIVLYICVVVSSLPLALLLSLASGFLFGALPGTLYTNIGATIGGTISFLLYRYFFKDFVQTRYARKLKKINVALQKEGTTYLLSIRLVPLVPFFIMNMLISVLPISLTTFIWTTSLGIIPGTLVYAFAGRQLATINTLQVVFTTPVLMALGGLLLLALLPFITKKR